MWPNPRETADLVTFTGVILNGKLHFLCSVSFSFLTDKVLKEFNEGLLTGMILIDLQKTFDTIDHEVLLQKVKVIKFSKSTIK